MKIDPDDAYAYGKQHGQKINHNRLERLRRDRIKESYQGLRSSIRVKDNLSRVDALKAAIAFLEDMNEKKRRILERIKEKELIKKRLYEKIRAKGLQNRVSLHDMEDFSESETESCQETNEN